ncbi:MAG: class I adenylate-forming enzyme family protein [Gammaproteobacteria bacterium]
MNGPATVVDAVARHAAERPSAIALSGAGRQWTYGALHADAGRLAHGFSAAGAGRGRTVAIVCGNHPLGAVAWLAAMRAGATPSMVNSLLRAQELAFILGHLAPVVVVADAAHLPVVREALAAAGHAAAVVLLDGTADLPTLVEWLSGAGFEGPLPEAGDASEIAYTSGTTSNPKGVVLTHAAVLHRAAQQRAVLGLGSEDTALAVTPLFHQSGIRDCVLLMWHCGGHAAIAPRFSASSFWGQAIAAGATYTCMVETMILLLEQQAPSNSERAHRIRVVMGGGAPDVRARAQARFGFQAVPGYGMTECGFPVAVPPDRSADDLQPYLAAANGASFAGWPVGDNQVRVIDAHGHDVPEGGQGEILVRSKTLLREYFRNPEATAAALRDGWLHTGDLGMRGANGSLYFVDRIKDVIRRGGENIASKEIETVIQAHPDVARAVAYPVPDPLFGQEAKVIVIARPGAAPSAAAIWAWCDARLARYKVPRFVEFRDAIPTSGSGRAQKQALRAEPIEGLGRTYDRRAEGGS